MYGIYLFESDDMRIRCLPSLSLPMKVNVYVLPHSAQILIAS